MYAGKVDTMNAIEYAYEPPLDVAKLRASGGLDWKQN